MYGNLSLTCAGAAEHWVITAVSRARISQGWTCQMLYMVIEHFRGGNAVPVYRRFRDKGRLAPEGLSYVTSWVTTDLKRCYQVMECSDRALLDAWIAGWSDLVEFEVIPVVTSHEAAAALAPHL